MSEIYFENIQVIPGIVEMDCRSNDDSLNLDDRLYFKFSEEILVDDNQIATALATLCGQVYDFVFMDLKINHDVFSKINEYLEADFKTNGILQDEIDFNYSDNLLLCFSGGFDSLATYELLNKSDYNFDIVSLDFGGRFSREENFFKRFSPYVVKTNFVDLKLNRNSMSFMYIPIIFYSKYLDAGYGMLADVLESGYNLYKRSDDVPLSFLNITNLPLVLGLTEVGLAYILIKTRPELLNLSLESLANPGEEKRYRKQLLIEILSEKYDEKVFFEKVGHTNAREWGDYITNDFLCLYFIKNAGIEEASKIMNNIPEEAIALANSLSLDFYERFNRDFLFEIPNEYRMLIKSRLCELNIDDYDNNDLEEYEKVIEFLSQFHNVKY